MADAVCLSHMIGDYRGNLEQALEAYRSRRVIRTARVKLQSRAIGERVYHPRAKSSDDWYDALARLYSGTGLEEKYAA
jgi:hypothetical protein